MITMKLTIPDERLQGLSVSERDVLVDVAIGCYKRRSVSLGRAAAIAGIYSSAGMTVVSDTSCITTLLKAAQLGLAEALCGVLQVPTAVWEELVVFHQQVPAGVVRTGANGGARLASGLDELGRGEAEAITLALQISADLFLTDDQEAARAALGLKVIGTVGLTLLAKRKGLIPSVRETLDLLQERGGLYLSEAVRLEALRLAGEE